MKYTIYQNAPKFEPINGAEMALIGDGIKMTLVRVYIRPGTIFEEHSHHNEQIGTCLQGRGILKSGNNYLEVKPDISWVIPSGEFHEFKAVGKEPVILLESWSPPREDYRKLAKIA